MRWRCHGTCPGSSPLNADHRLADHVPQRPVGRRRGEPLAQPRQPVVEVAPHHVVLRAEVAEERPPADARCRRDVVHRGLVEALASNSAKATRSSSARVVAAAAGAHHRSLSAPVPLLWPEAGAPSRHRGACHDRPPSSAARSADRPETAGGRGATEDVLAAGAVVAPAIDEPLVEEELLVEEVSIDGMCGVY